MPQKKMLDAICCQLINWGYENVEPFMSDFIVGNDHGTNVLIHVKVRGDDFSTDTPSIDRFRNAWEKYNGLDDKPNWTGDDVFTVMSVRFDEVQALMVGRRQFLCRLVKYCR